MNKKYHIFLFVSLSFFFSHCEKKNNNFITLKFETQNKDHVELYVEAAHEPSNDYFNCLNIYDTRLIKHTHTFLNIISSDRLNIYVHNDKLPVMLSLTGKIDEKPVHKNIVFSAQDNIESASDAYMNILDKNTKLYKYVITFRKNGEINHSKHYILTLYGETFANQMRTIQNHDKNDKE